ncbi:MAG: FAD-dependent monooxygenase [Gordonia sp. (in: high G+C Gram-positive bacteria)]|uniref:FAD-dependent monooxygenase n=1 Tax=Gordonia sp. (in: high G+C Gram-positive bacteria) TaxID=84139 RepID=UPI0039E58C87
MTRSARPTAAVLGGGISGLCAAIALRQRGWDAVVFEETESVVVGAGITIWANGLSGLDVLGVADDVRAAAGDMTLVRIVDWRGRELMRQRSEAGTLVALHRRDLNAALLAALPDDVVHTQTSATVVDAKRGVVEADGREQQYDLVVAADGVHSETRTRWWPEAGGERDCGIRAWRAVVDGAAAEALTVWCPAGECGILPLPDDTTYVFGASRGRARDAGLAYFDDWVEPVPSLLREIDEPIVHDLTDLDPVRRPVKGRTVLIGDAAHALRPHLGQGAGLSIEDAVVLGQHCSSSGRFDGEGFAKARRRRWAAVSLLARRASSVMMPTNPVFGATHRLAPLMPDRLMMGAVDRIAGWRA